MRIQVLLYYYLLADQMGLVNLKYSIGIKDVKSRGLVFGEEKKSNDNDMSVMWVYFYIISDEFWYASHM